MRVTESSQNIQGTHSSLAYKHGINDWQHGEQPTLPTCPATPNFKPSSRRYSHLLRVFNSTRPCRLTSKLSSTKVLTAPSTNSSTSTLAANTSISRLLRSSTHATDLRCTTRAITSKPSHLPTPAPSFSRRSPLQSSCQDNHTLHSWTMSSTTWVNNTKRRPANHQINLSCVWRSLNKFKTSTRRL